MLVSVGEYASWNFGSSCVFLTTEPKFPHRDAVSSTAAPQHGSLMSTGKILLVEDEVLIALGLQEGLGEAGFEVEVVHTGAEAAAALDVACASYSALLTDIRLPIDGPNGFDLGHKARELSPDIAVVYMSGDSAEQWKANGVPKSVMLSKPFAIAQLITALSNLLNETP